MPRGDPTLRNRARSRARKGPLTPSRQAHRRYRLHGSGGGGSGAGGNHHSDALLPAHAVGPDDDTILTLTDKHNAKQPLTHRGTYHLIQLHIDLRPEELQHPFQILLSAPLQLVENSAARRQHATASEERTAGNEEKEGAGEEEEDEDDRNEDRERGILCVVSNEDSDIRPAFSLFPARPGCHIVRSMIDQQLAQMAIVRLSLNLFALRIITPLLRRLPLRRKGTHHAALHDCLALHLPELTFEATRIAGGSGDDDTPPATDTELTPSLTVQVRHALCWHRVEGGISGPRGLTSRLSVRLSEATAAALGPSVFGRLELDAESPADLTLSSLTLYQDCVLRFNVTCDRSEGPSDPVSFRLRLRRETVRRPFFSDAPLPYFVQRPGEDGLEVRVPYELCLKASHTLRIYRRFYGPYLGLFVPQNRQGLKMPVTVWLPRTWLEITVLVSGNHSNAADSSNASGDGVVNHSNHHNQSGQDDDGSGGVSLPRDSVLGRLYFISSKHTLNRGCLSALTYQVKSALHNRPAPQLSVLGASIALQDLLPMRLLSAEPTQEQQQTPATEKPSPVTLAMICGDL
ncbi:protein UL84 [Panine betaherpesvirus 2]|uniref:Protein UL84 n=1 Tax=Panine betaherpesvirus 2 TaxID=188763 RepID=Q8QS15_9BETA|nr:protein UL84 [Panine betaherpesvirus 2]AAM00723.1 protein UL84 [Panine betaherpesvirus 2]QXV67833.1 protein UL84 [Panine betaherpesvirus 2]